MLPPPPRTFHPDRYQQTSPREAAIALALIVAIVVVSCVVAMRIPSTTTVHLRDGCPTDAICEPPPIGSNQNVKAYYFTPTSTGDVTTLDPALATDATARQLTQLVFDSLVTLDANLKPELWGADALTVSADGLTYTFRMRAGQHFSDGSVVRASDYAFGLDRALNPCLGAPEQPALLALRGALLFRAEPCVAGVPQGNFSTLIGDAIQDDDSAGTLTLILARPMGGFLSALAALPAVALERDAFGSTTLDPSGTWLGALSDGLTGKGGSGLFFVSSWDHMGRLVLKQNPYWWGIFDGSKKPHFTEIDVHLYTNVNDEFAAYDNDLYATLLDQVPANDIAAITTASDYRSVPVLATWGLAFNWAEPPFDSPDARQAFCLAVLREDSTFTTLGNPTWHVLPQGMPGYNPDLVGPDAIPVTGDSLQANQHWQDYVATHQGTQVAAPTLSFDASDGKAKAVATYLGIIWHDTLGFTVRLDPQPPEQLRQAEERHAVQIAITSLAPAYPDPEVALAPLVTTNPANVWHIGVPAADALVAQAATIAKPSQQAQRIALYDQAEQLYVNAVAYCPLVQIAHPYRMRTWVLGMSADASGLYPLDDWASAFLTPDEPAA